MTVKLDIASETQSRLEARARAHGMSLTQFLQYILDGIAHADEDQDRLALAGERLAAQTWPAEDFSDWK